MAKSRFAALLCQCIISPSQASVTCAAQAEKSRSASVRAALSVAKSAIKPSLSLSLTEGGGQPAKRAIHARSP